MAKKQKTDKDSTNHFFQLQCLLAFTATAMAAATIAVMTSLQYGAAAAAGTKLMAAGAFMAVNPAAIVPFAIFGFIGLAVLLACLCGSGSSSTVYTSGYPRTNSFFYTGHHHHTGHGGTTHVHTGGGGFGHTHTHGHGGGGVFGHGQTHGHGGGGFGHSHTHGHGGGGGHSHNHGHGGGGHSHTHGHR